MPTESFRVLKDNWFLIVFVFTVGVVYSEFQASKTKMRALQETVSEHNATLHRRVSATNDELQAIRLEIAKLREDASYAKGYIDAENKSRE